MIRTRLMIQAILQTLAIVMLGISLYAGSKSIFQLLLLIANSIIMGCSLVTEN